ncbi:hypothetical protein ROLI_036020 [Roseobacter fucihabitans]|uniref:Rod shape-determining protein MreD n=1 Tax=Roseobacter fucihabitans TaxID=1537242 RepID=A0ABZ2BWT3_9RHOB|nr:rod shape-determining protein MreD [Roseobacter litoralis]MBC6964536.1 hypothetical protein [Roseobacter litoralis]
MSDMPLTRMWMMRAGFAALVCVILFFHLLPLQTTPQRWVGPDFLLAFALAWSARRPEYVPTLALAGLFLLADLLLQRPPGLWAMLALLACEQIKTRADGSRDTNFVAEWLGVCALIIAINLGYRVILMITFVDLPSFGLTLSETIMTIIFYPLVALSTQFLMGVRKATPGDLDTIGSRS